MKLRDPAFAEPCQEIEVHMLQRVVNGKAWELAQKRGFSGDKMSISSVLATLGGGPKPGAVRNKRPVTLVGFDQNDALLGHQPGLSAVERRTRSPF